MMYTVSGFSQATYDSLTNDPEGYERKVAIFRTQKPSAGKILFLGNSITEGANWKKLLKDSSVVNRGISGDVTFGVLNRLDEVVRYKPSKLFLLIGVNDLSRNTPNAIIIQNIFAIVGKIHAGSPKTIIYVQSILPVNPSHKDFNVRFNKQKDIEEINGQLAKYSEALKYTYVNLFNHFLDDKFHMNLKFTYDGLHLNAAGYANWVSYLRKEKYL